MCPKIKLCYKHTLVVQGPSRPSKILQDRYLAELVARKRISFVICYIAFKTSISFKKHMKRGAHLLAPGPGDVEGVGTEMVLLLDGISVGGQSIQE